MTDDRPHHRSHRMRVVPGHGRPGPAEHLRSCLESSMYDYELSFSEFLARTTTVTAACFMLSTAVGLGFGLGWHVARRIKG